MIGHYRIYPAWFTGNSGTMAGHQAPMQELAHLEARRLGRVVKGIEIVSVGEDQRGQFLNFDVTYASSQLLEQSS